MNHWPTLVMSVGLLLVSGCAKSTESDAEMTDFGGKPAPADGAPASLDEVREQRGNVERLDLLLMVDNSGSMRVAQDLLANQIPRLIEQLLDGVSADGRRFAPMQDVHLAVVSSDMGLLGVEGIPGCEGGGDDGLMNLGPQSYTCTSGAPFCLCDPNCRQTYPSFLTFVDADASTSAGMTDIDCVTLLCESGCGFEQPLESLLKALWPARDESITFLADAEAGIRSQGHGDGKNMGFLREDPNALSLLVIILVSSENDCSAASPRLFTPKIYLESGDPLYDQDLNLRCLLNQDSLYPIERYVDGFKSLRPGNQDLVVFAALVGVPRDLVDDATQMAVDFTDDVERSAYYRSILDDPRMQEVADPNRTAEQGGRLIPSCYIDGPAYPPTRIVRVARGFAGQGIVRSICSDFGPAIDAITNLIADRLDQIN